MSFRELEHNNLDRCVSVVFNLGNRLYCVQSGVLINLDQLYRVLEAAYHYTTLLHAWCSGAERNVRSLMTMINRDLPYKLNQDFCDGIGREAKIVIYRGSF